MRYIALLAISLSVVACGGGGNLQINTAQLGYDCSVGKENDRYGFGTITIRTEGTSYFAGGLTLVSADSALELHIVTPGDDHERRVRVFATSLGFGSATFTIRGTVRTPTASLTPDPFGPLRQRTLAQTTEEPIFFNPIFQNNDAYFERTFTREFTIDAPDCPPSGDDADDGDGVPTDNSRKLLDDVGSTEAWELADNLLELGGTYEDGQLVYEPAPKSPYRVVAIRPKEAFPWTDAGIRDRQTTLIHDPAVDGAVTTVRIAMLAEVTFDFPADRADLTPIIYQENEDGILTAYLANKSFSFEQDLEDHEFQALEVNEPASGYTDPFTGNHPDFTAAGKPMTFGYELMARPHNGNVYLDLDDFEIEFDRPE